MTIAVVIERSEKSDNSDESLEILRVMGAKAIRQKRGRVKNKALCSMEDHDMRMIISTRHSLKGRGRWGNNPERRVLVSGIEPLLNATSQTEPFIESSVAISWQSLPKLFNTIDQESEREKVVL